MSAPRLTATTANAMLDNGIGTPANSGKLEVYDGTQPASGGGAITTQVKLVEFTMNADAFPAAVGGVLTANPIGAATAVATGQASWYRLKKQDGTVIIDGDVGVDGSPGDFDLHIDNVDITINDVVAVTSLAYTQPLA